MGGLVLAALLLCSLCPSAVAFVTPRPVLASGAQLRGRAAAACMSGSAAAAAGGAAGAKSPPVQIAWVGNSFVYFNKLPRMLAGMLAHDGEAVKQRDVLVGGRGLHGHSQDDNVTQLLVQRKWDVVVLQDQSAVPGGADEAKFGESITALQSFFAPKLIGFLCYLIHLFSIR